ncbi:MAG: PAS domain S-box protein [Smithella sp.]
MKKKIDELHKNKTDIHDTARKDKQAEKARRESAEQYLNFLENIHDGIFELDLVGNLTFFSDSICRILGYSREELMGMNFRRYTDRKTAKKVFETYDKVYNIGESSKRFNWQVTRKDGAKRYIETSESLQKDSSGKPIGFIGIVNDITERKRTEEALKQSESWYRTIFENTGTATIIIEEDKTISHANTEFEKLSGCSKKEIEERKHWEEFIVQEDLERMLTQNRQRIVDAKSAPKNCEIRFVDKGGAIKDIVLSIDMIPGTKKSIAFLLDITERKQGDEKLQHILESLRKAVDTTIQVMVSAVELRDPYTSGHQIRSADIAMAIATEMGLPQDKIDGIRMAGSIHDIGKLAIPAEILSKPTKLTDLEFSLIKEHSRSGYEILKDVESPWPLAEIIYQHHERMNGTGYPRNLKEDEILVEARIMAVADVVEAMASHRPYRASLGIEPALEKIEENKAILYDAAVADACLRLFREKGYQFHEIEKNNLIEYTITNNYQF